MAIVIGQFIPIVNLIVSVVCFIPLIAAGVRRMHDTGHSGWWLLCPIYNIVLLATPTDPNTNEYDAAPGKVLLAKIEDKVEVEKDGGITPPEEDQPFIFKITGPATCEVTDCKIFSETTTIPAVAVIDEKEYAITSIGKRAFRSHRMLKSITIPDSVTTIGEEAFSGCTQLSSIHIPDSVISIGDLAFFRCYAMTSVFISKSVSSISKSAFSGCDSLTSFVVAQDNAHYDSRDNCNAQIETSSNTLIMGFSNTVIPLSVTSIGDGAFSSCHDLTVIDIPNSVITIGKSAFGGCKNL